MLDIKLIRENPKLVRQALENRGDTLALQNVLEVDEHYRRLLRQVELLRAKHNETSKQLGKAKEKSPELIAQMRKLGDQISALQQETGQTRSNLESLLLEIPNIPHSSVILGKGESDNVVIRTWGEPQKFSFKPLPHWELGEKLDIIDFRRGVKLSGSRFYVLTGLGAHLQRALTAFMLDLHVTEHGYKEIYPPFMVRQECMIGSGNLPKFSDNLYHDDEDDLWFIPTAEVPLTNLHRDEILDARVLPLHYVAY
ncbi:MAG: serine--tRNA ligase, partial [Dehalococcoidia bacterium]